MKHIKLFENFLNESISYSLKKGNKQTFADVIEFLKEQKATFGYNVGKNDKFVEIPLNTATLDTNIKGYVAGFDDGSWIHIFFDKKGILIGAETWGANNGSWFTDEFDMKSEEQ